MPSAGNYQCFHCLHQSVIWDADFDFEDCGYEGQGIVHFCHCTHCGAEIEYRIAFVEDDSELSLEDLKNETD